MLVAAILNPNAQRVTAAVVRAAEARLGRANVFVTRSPDDASIAAKTIARRGYDRVAVGGGDGTFLRAVTDLVAFAGTRAPKLFALRLGSGNAIADVCRAGSSSPRGVERDLSRLSEMSSRPLSLLEVDGHLAHFAGAGLDAKVNVDFRDLIKRRLGRGPLGNVFHGVPGIVLALAMRTIPSLFLDPRARARIVNAGDPARPLDRAGASIPHGETIYEGPIIIAAASTITQFARGLTFFPYADDLDGAFQLRVSCLGAIELLTHLPSIFAGTYRNLTKAWDFAVNAVRFELEGDVPRQIGGDVAPPCASFEVRLSKSRASLLVTNH